MSQYTTPEKLQDIAMQELAMLSHKKELTTKERLAIPQQEMPVLEPATRAKLMEEVAIGYTKEQAILEAQRCLQCKKSALCRRLSCQCSYTSIYPKNYPR